jgi:hypothetical protein
MWIQIGFSIVANWIVAPFIMVRTTSTLFSFRYANSFAARLGLGLPP